MTKKFLLENPYNNYKENTTMIHYGNGAKNELKKENKNFNFKLYHRLPSNKIKFCSCGVDDINDLFNIIKPINDKYYIFEYIMENKKCHPYFDYEYEINKKPTPKQLIKEINEIIKLIKNVFVDLLKININDDIIKVMQSHGYKQNPNKPMFYSD